MRKILNIIYTIVLIIVLVYDLSAQTRRYVSPSGNNTTGTSWATAWTSFSSINWGNLFGGGYLYIDGGTDSIVYNQGLDMGNVMGGTNNYVYVMPGKYSPSPSGHSGRVIITSSGNGIDISSDGSSTRWIYIKGLEIRNGGAVGIRVTYNVKNLVIDSCMIIDNYSFGIELTGWPANDSHTDTSAIIENVEIKNNVIINRADDDGVDDNIIMKYNVNTLIHHNYLRNRNQQSNITGCADPNHTDNIQSSYGSPNMKIYNNICVEDSGASGQSIILGISSRNSNHYDTCLVYNNFIYNTGRIHGACDCHTHQVLYWRGSESQGQPGQYIPACFSINNTIIAANESCVGLADEYYGTIDVNNIVFEVGTNGNTPAKCGSVDGTWGSPYNGGVNQRKYIDSCKTNLMYRIYAASPEIGGNTWVRSNGTLTSISNWSDWLSKGGTGVNDNPDLETNYLYDELWDRTLWNYDLAKIKSTSPAIDAGTDVSYYIDGLFGYLPDISTDDIAGNPRNGTWDIGAFEFQQGIADTVPTFSFTALTGRELNTEYIATSPITGIDTVSHFWTTTSAEFKINYNGTYSTAMKTADPDNGADTVYVKNTTGGSYSTTYTETIVGGGHSEDFDVTTKADPAETIIIRILPGNR
jgi:hypothetical protein